MTSRVQPPARPLAQDSREHQTTAGRRLSPPHTGDRTGPPRPACLPDRNAIGSGPGSTRAGAGADAPRAFTLVEALVVLGAVAVTLGLLLPALSSARHAAHETQGLSQVREIGSAARAHMTDHADRLPQVRLTPNGDVSRDRSALHVGWLFGGARSIVNVFSAASIGADQRPLNPYLGDFAADDRPGVFLDPLDSGTNDDQLTGFAPQRRDATVYDLIGTSYALNDHALDTVPCPLVEIYDTLIPPGGGPVPRIEDPSRTWLVGQSPIYNYDDAGDKGERWGRDRVRASLAFADGHAEPAVPVTPGAVNVTDRYTFFPRRDWASRFEHTTFLPQHD